MNSTTINQGKMFKKYQKKIISQTNKSIMGNTIQYTSKVSKNSEINDNSKSKSKGWGLNWWTKEGMENGQVSEIQSLTEQLDKLLADYKSSHSTLIRKTDNYSTITGTKSSYSNNFVSFTTGHICYVTDQGIVKWITNPDVLNSIKGKFGYTSNQPIRIELPWLPEYNNAGTIVPTNPPLLTGTPISTIDEVALNAGKNVFVNSMVKDTTTKYVGCYRDKPENKSINVVPVLTSDIDKGFTVRASSTYLGNYDSFGPFRGFDQNKDTFWHSEVSSVCNYNAQTGVYEGSNYVPVGPDQFKCEHLYIEFPNAQVVSTYKIIPRQDGISVVTRSPNSWVIMGLNDGGNWTKIDEQTNQDFTAAGKTYYIATPGNYKYYLIGITKVGNNDQTNNRYCVQIAEWNMFISSDSTFTNDNRAMTYDMGAYTTFEECKRRAMDSGYKYFGLQDVNNEGKAACLFSNDIARTQMYGEAINTNMIPIWSSGTAGKSVSGVTLTADGRFIITESGTGVHLWTSPNNPSSCWWGGHVNPDSVQGSFGGNCIGKPVSIDCGNPQSTSYGPEGLAGNLNDELKKYVTDYVNKGVVNFSIPSQEVWKGGDPAFCCSKLVDYTYQCGGDPFKSASLGMGGLMTFDCGSEVSKCSFKLTLQQDGNMCLYQDNVAAAVWCTMTNGQQKDANPDWVATKGKTGVSYLITGQVLGLDEWIGSDDGRLKLIMQTDGNLVLYACTRNPGCINKGEQTYGGGWVNAVYEFAEQGNSADMLKMGYVDSNGVLSEYPPELIGKTNKFITVPNFDTPGNDFAGMPLQNENAENCQKICADNNDCAGVIFDRSNNNCWLKNSNMFPRAPRNENLNLDMYIRIPSVDNDNSCSKNIVPIDSVSWDRYKKSGVNMAKDTTCGLAKVVEPSIQSTNEMKQQIADLAGKIVEKINTLASSSTQLNAEMDKTSADLLKNMDKYKKINEDFSKQSGTYAVNINGILSETDQQVLQQNYNYMFWSILAIGIIIIIMNMKKR